VATQRNTLTIRVSEDLKHRIEKVATLQGVSINQFALYAFTKEIADLEASSYLRNLLKRVDKRTMTQEMDRIPAAVPERHVPDWDAMGERPRVLQVATGVHDPGIQIELDGTHLAPLLAWHRPENPRHERLDLYVRIAARTGTFRLGASRPRRTASPAGRTRTRRGRRPRPAPHVLCPGRRRGTIAAEARQRMTPNIVSILADGLGYGDSRCINPASAIASRDGSGVPAPNGPPPRRPLAPPVRRSPLRQASACSNV
jgi:uncharacterized protein (DUF1778 family)